MASSTPLCGICDFRHVSKPAVVWCFECDEKLCTDCSDHHSSAEITRHHTTTPIVEYQKLPSNVLAEKQFCKEHDEKFTQFCKEHDCPCCVTCILKNHKQCKGISKIDDVVKNVKASHSFQETEQILTELVLNIQRIQKDRYQNLVSLVNSKIQIEKEIKEFRVKVNVHLDKLQEDIINEMKKAEETERKLIQKIVDDLEKKEKQINEMQVNFSNIKQYASDLYAYLSVKKIQDDVGQTETAVDSMINSDKLQQKFLSLEINAAMKKIMMGVKRFGRIVVEAKGCNVVMSKTKHQQAQFLVPQQPRTITDITLQFEQTLDVDSSSIMGCSSLPNGRLVFTDCPNKNLIFINADGTNNNTLTISSGAFDIVYVKYNNSLAVTSGMGLNRCITFINITSNKVNETIELNSKCYGLTVKDHILFYCTGDSIMSLNLKDKSITKFKDVKHAPFTYIDIYETNLFYTNRNTNTITCYDLSGEVKWQFKDGNILKQPFGISVDNRGNVYVAGGLTSNVVVISPDGQKCRELLSSKDNLKNPWAIHYDRSTNNLLVANDSNKKVFMYKVT